MQWSTFNSNNENGLLKSNGPYRLRTANSSFTGVQRPQVIESTNLITIGEVKVYGVPEKESTDKKEPTDTQ